MTLFIYGHYVCQEFQSDRRGEQTCSGRISRAKRTDRATIDQPEARDTSTRDQNLDRLNCAGAQATVVLVKQREERHVCSWQELNSD